MRRKLPERSGVTLLELLVVMTIVSVLAGLLVPALQATRARARAVQCQAHLHQIGIALDMYVDAQGRFGKYPRAAVVPSITPAQPSLVQVLDPFLGQRTAVYACPADPSYFAHEGLSYEYPAFRLGGRTRAEVIRDRPSSEVWLLYDSGDFHAYPFGPQARNVLFADGHVDSVARQ